MLVVFNYKLCFTDSKYMFRKNVNFGTSSVNSGFIYKSYSNIGLEMKKSPEKSLHTIKLHYYTQPPKALSQCFPVRQGHEYKRPATK